MRSRRGWRLPSIRNHLGWVFISFIIFFVIVIVVVIIIVIVIVKRKATAKYEEPFRVSPSF